MNLYAHQINSQDGLGFLKHASLRDKTHTPHFCFLSVQVEIHGPGHKKHVHNVTFASQQCSQNYKTIFKPKKHIRWSHRSAELPSNTAHRNNVTGHTRSHDEAHI